MLYLTMRSVLFLMSDDFTVHDFYVAVHPK